MPRSRDVFVRAAGPDDQRDAVARGLGRTPNPRAVAGGHAADELCKAWEGYLEHQHALAETRAADLLLYIDHTEPRVRYVRTEPGHGPLYQRVGVGPCDYLGALTERWGYRPIAIEAKARTGQIVLEEDLPLHQRERLELVAAGGGIALLAVRLVDVHGVVMVDAAVPWTRAPWVTLRTRHVLRPGDVAPWRMPPGRIYLDPIARGEGAWGGDEP